MMWEGEVYTNGLEMKGAGPTKNSDMPEIREPVRINFLVPYIEKVYMYVTDVCIITQYCY